MKLDLLMNSNTLICIWILVFPIGIIEFSTWRKCCFWLFFISLHDYGPRSSWNALVQTSCGEMERCESCAFQLLEMRKKKISSNLKTRVRNRLLLTVRCSSMKDYTFHYVVSTRKKNVYINFNKNNENLEVICLK